ncbi:MAG: YheV family putative zinc ribbon protein [Pseudomonadales bacterium]
MSTKATRRFIAGAICPQCQAMDKIVLHRRGDQQQRECVACGFKDDLQEFGAAPELATRVTPQSNTSDAVQAVTLIDLSKEPKSKPR